MVLVCWVLRERQLPTDTLRVDDRELCPTHPAHRSGTFSFRIADDDSSHEEMTRGEASPRSQSSLRASRKHDV